MPMRLLYGYRRDGSGAVTIDPVPASVVCAVLAWPAQRRVGLGQQVVRSLLPGMTREAVMSLVTRIRHHAPQYRRGQAHASLPADPRLILSRAVYSAGAPSCGSMMREDTPTPRLPNRGVVVE